MLMTVGRLVSDPRRLPLPRMAGKHCQQRDAGRVTPLDQLASTFTARWTATSVRGTVKDRGRIALREMFVIPTLMSLPFARGTSTLLATPAKLFWVFGCPALNCGTESSSSEGDVSSAGRD